MKPPPFEVADIIRSYGNSFIEKNRSWLTRERLRDLLGEGQTTSGDAGFSNPREFT